MIHHASHPMTTVQTTRMRVEQRARRVATRQARVVQRAKATGGAVPRVPRAPQVLQREAAARPAPAISGGDVGMTTLSSRAGPSITRSDSTGRLSGTESALSVRTPGRRGRYSDHGAPTFALDLDGGEVDADLGVDQCAVDGEGSDGEQLCRTAVAVRPVPEIVGGPDSPRTPAPRPTAAATSRSAVRHASRPITSDGSQSSSRSTVGPPNAFTPKYSSSHSSTATPACSARPRTNASAARALASASGHGYANRASPAQPGRRAHETLVRLGWRPAARP